MTKNDIEYHTNMKKGDKTYPLLPKHISAPSKKTKLLASKQSLREDSLGDYTQSTIRGFNSRVKNWEKAQERYSHSRVQE
jgi:hypothetical protein